MRIKRLHATYVLHLVIQAMISNLGFFDLFARKNFLVQDDQFSICNNYLICSACSDQMSDFHGKTSLVRVH